jgi:hypothetical protein
MAKNKVNPFVAYLLVNCKGNLEELINFAEREKREYRELRPSIYSPPDLQFDTEIKEIDKAVEAIKRLVEDYRNLGLALPSQVENFYRGLQYWYRINRRDADRIFSRLTSTCVKQATL